MKYYSIAGKKVSAVIQGCMRFGRIEQSQVDSVMKTALECGINFFDNADIYTNGLCEEKLGKFLADNPGVRDKIVIQTKCGIKKNPSSYDFSKEHILSSVDGSLKRMGIEHIDFLLLHRPDALCDPEEVAEAFDTLYNSGKVGHFGVSNHNPMQIELLKKYLGKNRIVFNQLQFSLANTTIIDCGLNVNMTNDAAINRDDSVLDYCRLNGITIQPWSPFQFGFFGGVFIGNPDFPELNSTLDTISDKYGITPTGLAISWILRHPAKMQPIIGTMTPSRIKEICNACDVTITHDEWYDLYRSAGNKLP